MKQHLLRFVLLTVAAYSIFSAGAQSQMEMNLEAAKRFEKADAQLNAVYKKVLADLDATGKKKLKEAQRAWIVFRDAEAAFQADGERGGSLEAHIYSTTQRELTEARTAELTKHTSSDSKEKE